MGDTIAKESLIKELGEVQVYLRSIGEYRKANMIDFAVGYVGSTVWEELYEFFQSEKRIEPFFKEVEKEIATDKHYPLFHMYLTTIKRLLDKNDELEAEVNFI